MMTSTRNTDKRKNRRMRKELIVGLCANSETQMAYSLDLSRGGVKVGSPTLYLGVGEPVSVMLDRSGGKECFVGTVQRNDGLQYIERIRRSGNVYFIRIDAADFPRFIADHYFIY